MNLQKDFNNTTAKTSTSIMKTKSFYILAVPTCIPPNGHLDKTCSQSGSEIFKTF